MKAVLISIRPKWCEKIVNGKKTIEVRKTRPKLETPFKCYIYCTLRRYPHEDFIETDYPKPQFYGGGKVIGEFVCDWIYQYSSADHLYGVDISHADMARQSCLTRKQIEAYELKNAPEEGYFYFGVFGWHISNLKIYDVPRELASLTGLRATRFGAAPYDIKRAPQSWCYVEEREHDAPAHPEKTK